MRTTHFGLPIHLLALCTLGPQLLNDDDDDDKGGGGGGEPGPIPYSRFQKLNTKYGESRARVAELEAEVQSLTEKGATVDTLSRTLQESQESWTKERTALQERLGLAELGLTSQEGQTVARSLYGTLDEETRGKVAFTDQVKAWKEKPEEAPAGLRPYLGQPGKDADLGTRRNANKGTNGNGEPDSSGGVTLAALQAARMKAQKTGSWDEYNKLVAAAQ